MLGLNALIGCFEYAENRGIGYAYSPLEHLCSRLNRLLYSAELSILGVVEPARLIPGFFSRLLDLGLGVVGCHHLEILHLFFVIGAFGNLP